MDYEIVTLEKKLIVGITARTGNNDPDCLKIIGSLWKDFMEGGIGSSIKNRLDKYIIALYSNYDETSYDVTVGAQVSKNENMELSLKTIPEGKYAVFHIKGDVVTDVSNAWNEIWAMSLERSFTGDFEEYLSNENGVSEIDIYIALK